MANDMVHVIISHRSKQKTQQHDQQSLNYKKRLLHVHISLLCTGNMKSKFK